MTMMTRKDKPEKKIFLVLGGLAVLVVLGVWAYAKFNEFQKNGGNIAIPKISLPAGLSAKKVVEVLPVNIETAVILTKVHFGSGYSETENDDNYPLYILDHSKDAMVQIGFVNKNSFQTTEERLKGKRSVTPLNKSPYFGFFFVNEADAKQAERNAERNKEEE